jgi:hypothetical protein
MDDDQITAVLKGIEGRLESIEQRLDRAEPMTASSAARRMTAGYEAEQKRRKAAEPEADGDE